MSTDEQSTSIPQLYLWAVGLDTLAYPPGSKLGDRYSVVESQILLDTQIYRLPECAEELTLETATYLKLSRFPLQLPRPYALLPLEAGELLILDRVPISAEGKLLPSLADSWAGATALRQINWLWQVLQLWTSLAELGVASTLLDPIALRVDGSWVKILQLRGDQEVIKLAQLGTLWVDWLDSAQPQIKDQLTELFFGLLGGELDQIGAISYLDQLNRQLMASQPFRARVATATDKGQRRSHNEDTCYPDPTKPDAEIPAYLRDRLVIICDGLGGHEGGEVASGMAIQTLERQLHILLRQVEADQEPFVANTFMAQLQAIMRVVNDQIVALNDLQHRQAQQRMGTTLVMAVIPRPQGKNGNEVFIVNVGDSRLYWLNPRSCYQATLDDDVATRDTVLGYSLPAYSMQRIDAASLTQALGTRASDVMIPTVQRFLIDEACLLLLCSDGLSDYERVPDLWRSHLLPVIMGSVTLTQACKNLIEQGNLRNGHDNITVGLIHCQFMQPSVTAIADPDSSISSPDLAITELQDLTSVQPIAAISPTQNLAPDLDQPEDASAPQPNNRFALIGLILVMLCLGGGIAASLYFNQSQTFDQIPTQAPSPSLSPAPPQ